MRTIFSGLCGTLLPFAFVAACASGNANPAVGAAGTAATGAAQQGAASAGSSLGISDSLVQVAMTAAKSFLGDKKDPTPEDKGAAAKSGVDAAAAKAKEGGQELSPTQQTGLMDLVKNAL